MGNKEKNTSHKPSKKQKDYAENIAKVLNLKLPEEDTSAAYQAFISENQERFSQNKPQALHYTDEQIARANAVDILDYARSQGLELKREGKDYKVKNYSGGFIISPEKNNWNWFAGNQGGGVVQLCMFLEQKTWPEAIGTLLDEEMEPIRRAPSWKPEPEKPKEFHLPPKNNTNKHVYAYLTKTRGIDAGIVKEMLDKGYIYENDKRSCVFVGRDSEGIPRHASVRSTNTTGNVYKKDVSGSQKKYSFSVTGTSGTLYVFEAPIDALSYMSLQKQQGTPINNSYVALGGVTDKALERYVDDYKDIQKIVVCTDADEAGEMAAKKIQEKYGEQFEIARQRPTHKDFNEDLVAVMEGVQSEKLLYQVPAVEKGDKIMENNYRYRITAYLKDNEEVSYSNVENARNKEKSFAEQVDEVLDGTFPFYSALKVCDTPDILLEVGCEQLPMLYTQKHLKNAIKPIDKKEHYHGLTVEQIKKIPVLIENPVMVLDSISASDSLVIVTSDTDMQDNPILVSIKPNGKGKYEIQDVKANFITSIYGRNNFIDYIKRVVNQDNLLFCNKQKSQELFGRWGEQYSELTNNLNFNSIIHQSRNIVKKNKITVAIESTVDFTDSEAGFVSFATETMPAGTKYRLVTFGENGALVPYEGNLKIYTSHSEIKSYVEEHQDELETMLYDEAVYQAGRKLAENISIQHNMIDEGMHSFQFDDEGYLHFSLALEGYQYQGYYRVYDPENGPSRTLMYIENELEPMIIQNREYIERKLFHYVNDNPLIGENGEKISREKASIYCEWSESAFFEEGKVYSVAQFDNLMKQADTEYVELRQKEQEEYGGADEAAEQLRKQGLPAHQGYQKVKYTIYIPGMETLTLRQDVGDGFGGVIDYIKRTSHKQYVEPLTVASIHQELDEAAHRTQVENQAVELQTEMKYEEANELLDALDDSKVMPADNASGKDVLNDYAAFADTHKQFIQNTDVNRIPVVINAFGGPGSGKSVSCMDICQQLKKQGYNAEYVQEYAKDLVYDENWKLLDGTPEHQFEILKEQLQRVDRLYGNVDFIVTDSPVLLNGVYNKALTPEYDTMVTSLQNDFENFTYFVERDASAFQQEGRIHNLDESQKIDQEIKQLLKEKEIYYGTYNHNTIDKVVSNVIHTFNRINYIEEPATTKQIAYAEKIAGSLSINVPEEKTKAAYQAFISENQEAFSKMLAPLHQENPENDNYESYLDMVSKDGSRLQDVPVEHYSEELLLAAVSNWGAAIKVIPEEKVSAEIALASVQQYGTNLKYVPDTLKSEEICVAAYISSSGKSLRFTPSDIKNQVKEKGQKRMAESNNANPNTRRQLEEQQLQENGQEWMTRIENMLKEHENNPEAMVEDIIFAAKFYQYSSRNIQLMYSQNSGITYVASASAFEKMGYHVKDNETAMIGRVPQFSKYITNEKGERVYSWNYTPEIKQKLKEGILKEQQSWKKFQYVAAFYDISQTDCPTEDYPSVFHMGVPSEFHQEAFDAMKAFAEKELGFRVMVTDLKSISLRGNCEPDNRIIRINERLEATMALSTLCHEIAHGIIHTSENSAKMTTAQKECEADVMDIMLESSLGLPINESRREHLYHAFHNYKEEQAAKEQPYEVTLEKLIDRVQSKVFRPYVTDINNYLDIYLPAEGSQAEETAKEVIKNLALLDSAYETSHSDRIDTNNELFDGNRMEDYQQLYEQTREEQRLSNSFVPKLAIFKCMDGEIYDLSHVELLDYTTAELFRSYPENLTPEALPYNVEVSNILAFKANVLEPSYLFVVSSNGLKDVTSELGSAFSSMEYKINCGFDAQTEYRCIQNLLKNGIALEKIYEKKYEHLCNAFGFDKKPAQDTSTQLMARINLIIEDLSMNNRELITEYVFRTGNYEKAEQYAKQIEKEPGITKQLLQEMKLVDSYKYMLWSIADYEDNHDVPAEKRITTGAYNSASIPVLSDNVSSLSQINDAFVLISKHASKESTKSYIIVGEEETYRFAYVELNDYVPQITYSTIAFDDYDKAKEYYDRYLDGFNSKLKTVTQLEELVSVENKDNPIALSDITTIGTTIASQKQQYMESGMNEEKAFELLRTEMKQQKPEQQEETTKVSDEIQVLKDFKKMISQYGEEHFIELCNLSWHEQSSGESITEPAVLEEAMTLSKWLGEQRNIVADITVSGMDAVIHCMDEALNCSLSRTEIEKAFNAIDAAVLSAEFADIQTQYEGFEDYNNVLDTLKAARVNPDKFCYVDYESAHGSFLYTCDPAGNIYRKSIRDEWNGSVSELHTGLKEAGYEICLSFDDFKVYAANNRLGMADTQEKEKAEAYVRVLESTSDVLQKNQILSINEFKSTIDKLYSGTGDIREDITYKLVTRKDQEIHSYIDTYSGDEEQNVYEQLYDKAKEQTPELSKTISRQYYQDQINFNEKHQIRPLMKNIKKQNQSPEDSEDLAGLLNANDRLKEAIKKLDLSPADAELLKLNVGNLQTDRIVNMEQQMKPEMQQKQKAQLEMV